MADRSRSTRKPRPYQAFLSPWEAVQLDCLAAARAAIWASDRGRGAGRSDATAKLFTKRMADIRNNARQRERLARGVHSSQQRKRK